MASEPRRHLNVVTLHNNSVMSAVISLSCFFAWIVTNKNLPEDITLCSPLKVSRLFGGTSRPLSRSKNKPGKIPAWKRPCCLPPAFTLVSCFSYSSTLKVEAIYSSETSADFQRSTQRYIPEDSTFHNHRSENLKSYKNFPGFIQFVMCNKKGNNYGN
jgi:hypothetical protein